MSEEHSVRDRIEHCHRGLTNAQETIRFIDTKNGVIIGIGAALIGWTATKVIPLIGSLQFNKYFSWFLGGLVLAVLVLMGMIILFSILSLLARAPKPCGKHLMLFPFVKSEDFDAAHTHYKRQVKNHDITVVLDEYANQLTNLGVICGRKICWHRRAVKCGIWGTIALLLLFGVVIVATASNPKKEDKPSAENDGKVAFCQYSHDISVFEKAFIS